MHSPRDVHTFSGRYFPLFGLLLLVLIAPSRLLSQGVHADDALRIEPQDSLKIVVDLSLAALDMGLDEEQVRQGCELRLRQAMIPVATDSANTTVHTLYVNINVSGSVTSINLAFAKLVLTTVAGVNYLRRVTTWTDNAEGPHNNSPEIIQAGLMNSMDKFVTEFLRTNRQG